MDERGGKNYALVKEKEFNLIFSLLRRTPVSSEKLIHAPSPPLVMFAKRKKISRVARADLGRGIRPTNVSPRKLVGSSRVGDEAPEFSLN